MGEIWATSGAAREQWLRERSPRIASAEEIERHCGSAAHQGVCAQAGPYPYVGAERLLDTGGGLLVALDQVQDPQNLGSICRTAECAGADGVLIPERRAAEVTAAVCKASAGAVEHLPVARVRNVADVLGEARKAGYWCYGASDLGGARRAARRFPMTGRTTPARGWCSCSAARARVCARAWPAPATS